MSHALDFLNRNTADDLNFFAIEVELWRIRDSPLAPKFQVVTIEAPQIRPQEPQHWRNIHIGRSGFGLNPTASNRDTCMGGRGLH